MLMATLMTQSLQGMSLFCILLNLQINVKKENRYHGLLNQVNLVDKDESEQECLSV